MTRAALAAALLALLAAGPACSRRDEEPGGDEARPVVPVHVATVAMRTVRPSGTCTNPRGPTSWDAHGWPSGATVPT